MLVALDFQRGPSRQIVIAGKPGAPDTDAMLQAARKPFLPRGVVLLADGGAGQEFLAAHVELFKDMKRLDGKATAYVCENFACHLPTTDLFVLRNPPATPAHREMTWTPGPSPASFG